MAARRSVARRSNSPSSSGRSTRSGVRPCATRTSSSTEMWNLGFTPPFVIHARVLTRVPDALRRRVRTDWSDANKPGQEVDCFLEGPTFDRDGNLYLVDIPFGRIFRVSPALEWSLVAQYDGWPNGLAMHRDGALWIADYRRGLLRLDVNGGQRDARTPVHVLGHRNSESFRGLNDL